MTTEIDDDKDCADGMAEGRSCVNVIKTYFLVTDGDKARVFVLYKLLWFE